VANAKKAELVFVAVLAVMWTTGPAVVYKLRIIDLFESFVIAISVQIAFAA
jgi:hypothetical protein